MQYIPNAIQMKNADQYTINTLNIPSLELMEQAAISCVEVLKENNFNLSHVCIVCGSGNNGGDGFAIARLLSNEGIKVSVVMAGNADRCTPETKHQIHRLLNTDVQIINNYNFSDYTVIIDAIFGVGLSRTIEGRYYQLIEHLNCSSAVKISVDIPSGICADNGNVLGIAFKSDYTVTFQNRKLGHLIYPGKDYCGKVIVKDIGISNDSFKNNCDLAVIYNPKEYRKMFPIRMADSHKGSYGKLLIIAGTKGMSGAAYMNALSAYMCGAGLVQIYTAEENRIILQTQLPEAIISTYNDYDDKELLKLIQWADTICIGSGIGTTDISRKILKTVILESEVPCVIDADGLNILSKHMWYLDKTKHKNFILTPHMKEMSRLSGLDIDTIKRNRVPIMTEFAEKYKVTCVLKDSITMVKSNGEYTVINTSGNSSMAKAGSGDVLAGIIAGILVQTKTCHTAAVLGTYLHGKSGDIARNKKGCYSVMARDLIECISEIFIREEGKYYEEI